MADADGGPGADAPLAWPREHSEQLGDFRHFRVRRDWCRSPRDGTLHDFYVLDMPDWVQVVPITASGRVVLVEQYRPGSGRVTLEFPAGLLEPGEEPVAAAVRELEEETGLRGDAPVLVGEVEPNPALQNNRLSIVLVEGCRAGGRPGGDPGEAIRVREVARDRLERLIGAGRFGTAHSLVAWDCYRRYSRRR
jgi:ADP-ribose pyrophosphatase